MWYAVNRLRRKIGCRGDDHLAAEQIQTNPPEIAREEVLAPRLDLPLSALADVLEA